MEETIYREGAVEVRRLVLEPGEAMRWHVDPVRRVAVVVRGERLRIEFRDGREALEVDVAPGLVEMEEPSEAVHRAVNVGGSVYEQVTVFFLERPGDDPQPTAG